MNHKLRNKHIFLMKYGTQEQRKSSLEDALYSIKTDPNITSIDRDNLGDRLWNHVDEHGDTPELKKFMLGLDEE